MILAKKIEHTKVQLDYIVTGDEGQVAIQAALEELAAYAAARLAEEVAKAAEAPAQ